MAEPQSQIEAVLRRQYSLPEPRVRQMVGADRKSRIVEALDADTNDKALHGPVQTTAIGAMDWFSTTDLIKGAVGGGLRDAAQEVMDGISAFHDVTGNVQEKLLTTVGVPESFAKALSLDVELPEIESETVAGTALRPVVSFIAGFLPLNRAMKAAGIAGNFTRDVLASAGAGALTVPSDAFTLADGLSEVPGLKEIVPEFLRSNPNDSTMEAKLTQAANEALGAGVGSALVRPLVAGLKYIRGARQVRATAGVPTPGYDAGKVNLPARINSWWLNGLVSGFSTQALNLSTNLANTLLVPAERILATTLAHGPVQGTRELVATAHGFVQGLEDAFRLAPGKPLSEQGTVFQTAVSGKAITDPATSKIDPEMYIVEPPDLRTVFKGGPAAVVGNVFDAMVTSGFTGITGARGLITGDEAFKTLLHRMELNRVASKEAFELGFKGQDYAKYVADRVRNPDGELLDQALNAARYGTFTQPVGRAGQALVNMRNALPLGKFFFPFVRTPSNIFKFAAERSLLGLLMKGVRDDLQSADRFTRNLAATRIAYGSALMALAYKWTVEGRVTGGGPVDRELYQLAKGDRPPYSVLVGDRWVGYQRAAPWGTLLGMAADLSEVSGQLTNEEFDKAHATILASIYRNTLDYPYTQGFSELANLMHNGFREGDESVVWRTAGDLGSTFVTPRVWAQYARALDPQMRSARTVLDLFRNQRAGYREDLPYAHDALGDEVILNEGYGEGNLGVFTRLALPFAIRKDEDRLRDVREFLIENEIDLGLPARAVQGVPIDEATYQRMVKRGGDLAVPLIRDLMRAPGIDRLTRLQKERLVKEQVANMRRVAADEVLASNPALQRRVAHFKAGLSEREDASMQRGVLSLELPR